MQPGLPRFTESESRMMEFPNQSGLSDKRKKPSSVGNVRKNAIGSIATSRAAEKAGLFDGLVTLIPRSSPDAVTKMLYCV